MQCTPLHYDIQVLIKYVVYCSTPGCTSTYQICGVLQYPRVYRYLSNMWCIAVPQGVQVRPVGAAQQPSSGTITMTPTGATGATQGIRPGTRIVRQRSPVTMTSQSVKVVSGTPGSQPQIISIPGGQQKTGLSSAGVVSCSLQYISFRSYFDARYINSNERLERMISICFA